MTDYEVGFARPPVHTRYQPGVSGNPSGKRKRRPSPLAEMVGKAFSGVIAYTEGGRAKRSPPFRIVLKRLVRRAVAGDLDAIETLLRALLQALHEKTGGAASIVVEGWLPDAPIGGAEVEGRDEGLAAADPFGEAALGGGASEAGDQEALPKALMAEPDREGA